MDRLKEYLGEIRLPAYQDVKSGEFFRRMLRGPDKVDSPGYLANLENNLIQLQEVLLWTNVRKSIAWLALSQIFLYQFSMSSTSVISSTAYTCLLTYLYITWTQKIWPTIKMPSEHKEDSEKWTAVHPDTLSAPEMENILNKIKERIIEIYSGLWLLRSEAPLRFCITMSTIFICTAIIGLKVSTPLLIHSVALAAFVIPPALLTLSRNPQTQPGLILVGEVICSLSNLLVYHGENYAPKESTELDDFLPDSSTENLKKLDISAKPRKETEDLSLLDPEQSIPSHEEVDLLALASPDLETDLMPCSNIQHDASDLEDEIEVPQGRLRGVEDSDTDSADGAFSLTEGASTSLTSYLPAVTSASAYLPSVTSVNQVLGGLIAATKSELETERDYRSGSEPNLEDFELISEEELDKVSP